MNAAKARTRGHTRIPFRGRSWRVLGPRDQLRAAGSAVDCVPASCRVVVHHGIEATRRAGVVSGNHLATASAVEQLHCCTDELRLWPVHPQFAGARGNPDGFDCDHVGNGRLWLRPPASARQAFLIHADAGHDDAAGIADDDPYLRHVRAYWLGRHVLALGPVGPGCEPLYGFPVSAVLREPARDLEDAAIVDGCGYYRIFWSIFLPLSKPVVATVAILQFQWVWNDWFTPLILPQRR